MLSVLSVSVCYTHTHSLLIMNNVSYVLKIAPFAILTNIFFSGGEDFIAIDKVFSLSPGQTELMVPIALVDDVIPECVEEFAVLLYTSPGVFVDTPARIIVTILNDDPGLPGTYIVSYTVDNYCIFVGAVVSMYIAYCEFLLLVMKRLKGR